MDFAKKILLKISLPETQQLYLLALLVGVISGLMAALFECGLHYFSGLLLVKVGNLNLSHPYGENSAQLFHFTALGEPLRWVLLVLPACGGLVSGFIIYRFCPEAGGDGTDAMIEAFHRKFGKINPLVPFIKGLTTILTMSTGGCSGKEGPVAQIGAGVGSSLATMLGIGVRARRTLLLAGTAGGLGAIFQAPLGGALTAVEIIYREDIESDALIPCIISSATAYTIFGSIFGFSHLFLLRGANNMRFAPGELCIFILMGILCSWVGCWYVKCFFGLKAKFFNRLKMPVYCRPAVGGLMLGVIGFFYIEVFGAGFGYVQSVIDQDFDSITWGTVGIFALIGGLKILGTSFTIGSGGSGGVFAPSLFIGAMVGAVVGGAAYLILPQMVESPFGAFVVVGMCSFFAGVAHAPIAAVIMVCEMTGGYKLLAPLMVVSVLAIIMSQKWSIYANQVKNKFFSPAHVGDMTVDILQDIQISSLAPYHQVGIVSAHTIFKKGENLCKKIHASDLVLIDHDDIYCGMVSMRDVNFDTNDPLICSLITLEDIMTPNVRTVTPEHNLHEALEIIMRSEFDKVPVLKSQSDKDPHLLGYISHNDILLKYHDIVNTNRIS